MTQELYTVSTDIHGTESTIEAIKDMVDITDTRDINSARPFVIRTMNISVDDYLGIRLIIRDVPKDKIYAAACVLETYPNFDKDKLYITRSDELKISAPVSAGQHIIMMDDELYKLHISAPDLEFMDKNSYVSFYKKLPSVPWYKRPFTFCSNWLKIGGCQKFENKNPDDISWVELREELQKRVGKINKRAVKPSNGLIYF